jgi:hypothetical protein
MAYDSVMSSGEKSEFVIRTRSLSHVNIQSFVLFFRDTWNPIATVWRVFRLRLEGWPPICEVAANILNKQSRTADKG